MSGPFNVDVQAIVLAIEDELWFALIGALGSEYEARWTSPIWRGPPTAIRREQIRIALRMEATN